MWHPHLKRNWINEKEFEIVDVDKNKYPAFLQITKNQNTFLSENKKKLQCSCKFVKEEEAPSKGVTGPNKRSDIISLIKRNMEENNPDGPVKDKDEMNNIATTDLLKNAEGLRLKEKNKIEIKTPIEHSSNPFTKKMKKIVKNKEPFDNLTSASDGFGLPLDIKDNFNKQPNPENADYMNLNIPDINGIMNYMQMNSAIMNNIQNLLLNYQRNSNTQPQTMNNNFYRPNYPNYPYYGFNNYALMPPIIPNIPSMPSMPNLSMPNLFRNNNMVENKDEDVYNLANKLFSKNVDKKMKNDNLNFFNR